jgi:hypothetical protein
MIDSGDSATTNASGISSVSTDPQFADIEGPFVASSGETVAIVAAREGCFWQPTRGMEGAVGPGNRVLIVLVEHS